MPAPVKTFDVFDTLLARRCVVPESVFAKLGQQAGIAGLAAARQAAPGLLAQRGEPFNLDQIWREVQRLLQLDTPRREELQALELRIEQAEIIPIVENLNQVSPGDLLVSDTYLPAEVLASWLNRAGLLQPVGLAVSSDGKYQGWIWRELQKRVQIAEHLGDNLNSDGQTPSVAGINAIIYVGARRSPVEERLAEEGLELLANLIREVRLANPFATMQPRERHLWLLTCQLNFPLLFLASHWLDGVAIDRGIRYLLLVSRDCWLWQELYPRLFPRPSVRYLYASRWCQRRPSADYLDYFNHVWQPEALVVDLFSTGSSWARFAQKRQCKLHLACIGHIDNHAYLPQENTDAEWVEIHAAFRTSELGGPLSKGAEMLNLVPYPSVLDVVRLPDGSPLPCFSAQLEYDPAWPRIAQRAFRACLEALPHYPDLLARVPADPVPLLRQFVQGACADRELPMIYAGLDAADAAYVERLRAATTASAAPAG